MSRFAARFAKLKHTRERQRCETRLTSAHLSTRSSIYNPIFVGDESHVIFCPSGAASFFLACHTHTASAACWAAALGLSRAHPAPMARHIKFLALAHEGKVGIAMYHRGRYRRVVGVGVS